MNAREFGFWTRIAAQFLIRSGRSTATLSFMVVTAVAALIFLSALSIGVNDAMLRNTVELFSGHITGYELDSSIHPQDLAIKGVRGALKRIYRQGILTTNGISLPLMLCGIDPEKEAALTALPKKVIEGSYPRNGKAELLISETLATELGIVKGDAVSFITPSNEELFQGTVSGIYRTGIDQLDRKISFVPASTIKGAQTTWTAAVFLEHRASTADIIQRYHKKFSGNYRFVSWQTLMPDLRQLIDLENISMTIVIILVFVVVAIGITCSFVIFIIKNIREYGIMKAMGVTTREMSLLITVQVVLMNAIACVVGMFIGCLIVWGVAVAGGIDIGRFTSHNQYFSVSGIIIPRLTPFSLGAPPAISLLFSLAASIWPVVLLARQRTADILRMI